MKRGPLFVEGERLAGPHHPVAPEAVVRQLQRPDEAGQDQDIDQTDNELGNLFAPDLDRCSCLHELWRYLDLNSLRPRQRAGGFVTPSAVSHGCAYAET
jgi:hypothetical protein